jgi:HSP20 family protein
MSNIVRKENGPPGASLNTWDPFRLMRDMLRWDPFREMAPYQWPEERVAFTPSFEVKETREAYLFKADVPGVKEPDLEVHLVKNRLTIQGKREAEKQDKDDSYFMYERSYGSFSRSFTLPDGIDSDHLKAELKDGVLTVVLPKAPEVKPKKIAVATSDKQKS